MNRYGIIIQKAPNVYFPSEDGHHKGNNQRYQLVKTTGGD